MDKLIQLVPRNITIESLGQPYRRRKVSEKGINVHWGQRKLLLSEIDFLNMFGDIGTIVVYAGAAPSTHTPYLQSLFPHLHFLLIDPSDFMFPVGTVARELISLEGYTLDPLIKIDYIRGYFTNDTAILLTKLLIDHKVLFISDVRTADHSLMTDTINEEAIAKDNQWQIDWVTIMNPIASMLKFRCIYAGKLNPAVHGDIAIKTPMLKGLIRIQTWAPESSSETRLIVDGRKPLELTYYDNQLYEDQLFHFNIKTRQHIFPQPIRGDGLTTSYDSSLEMIILYEYLIRIQSDKPLHIRLADMSYEISKSISMSGRILSSEVSQKKRFQSKDHAKAHDSSFKGLGASTSTSVDYDD